MNSLRRANSNPSTRVTKNTYSCHQQSSSRTKSAKLEHALSYDNSSQSQVVAGPAKKTKAKKNEEKRQRRYRSHPPGTFMEKLGRARTQRMIVVGRKRNGTDECPSEEIDIVGSTGNIYQVTIGKLPFCTCPDSIKGNECKHKVYALHTVLKARADLQYQLAFLSSELREIFANAPLIPNATVKDDSNGKRKSTDGECAICYMDLDEEQNTLVWCKGACGNNVHKSCFDQWAHAQGRGQVRCIYCRTPWEQDGGDYETIAKTGKVGDEGYVNVAEHFGLSSERDYSSYYSPWVRGRFGMGF